MQALVEPELQTAETTPANWRHPWRWFHHKIYTWVAEKKESWRVRRFKKARAFLKPGIYHWRTATSIPSADRIRLEKRFRHAWRAEYRRRFIEERLGTLFQAVIGIAWLFYFLILPLIIPDRYKGESYLDTLVLILCGSSLVFMIGVILISWLHKYLSGQFATAETARQVASVVFFMIFAGLIVYFASQTVSEPFLLIILGLLSWGVVFSVVIIVAWLALSIATHWARRRNPDLLLAAALFAALRSTEFNREGWPDPKFRASISRLLGTASTIARSFLFRGFKTTDLAVHGWQVRQAHFIAETLAQKQRWLMTPKRDTYEFLLAALASHTVAAISGVWDELAQSESTGSPTSQDTSSEFGARARGAWMIAIAWSQTIIVAVLPAAALWLLRSRGLLTTGGDSRLNEYLDIGAFVWAVVILAFQLDPRLQEKINGIKEVVSLVNPTSIGKRGS